MVSEVMIALYKSCHLASWNIVYIIGSHGQISTFYNQSCPFHYFSSPYNISFVVSLSLGICSFFTFGTAVSNALFLVSYLFIVSFHHAILILLLSMAMNQM
jgi:hypothetical protein